MSNSVQYPDHLHKGIGDALKKRCIDFTHQSQDRTLPLDFWLSESDTHIAFKKFKSDRNAPLLSQQNNVIFIQGIKAARLFISLIENQKL